MQHSEAVRACGRWTEVGSGAGGNASGGASNGQGRATSNSETSHTPRLLQARQNRLPASGLLWYPDMMLCAASLAILKRCPTPSLSTTGGPRSGKEPRKGSALQPAK